MRILIATVFLLLTCAVQAQAQQTKGSPEACRAGCNKYCQDRMAKKTINSVSGCQAACEQQQCKVSRTRI